jgi:hypothetical protein
MSLDESPGNRLFTIIAGVAWDAQTLHVCIAPDFQKWAVGAIYLIPVCIIVRMVRSSRLGVFPETDSYKFDNVHRYRVSRLAIQPKRLWIPE